MYQGRQKSPLAALQNAGQPQPMQPRMAPAPQAGPQQQGPLSQLGDMAQAKVMGKVADKGANMLDEKVMSPMLAKAEGALTGMAGENAMLSGAMSGMGAAMPWIGAGILGGKMLGLFSQGGLVGPLAGVKYKSNGGEVSDEINYTFVSPLSAKE